MPDHPCPSLPDKSSWRFDAIACSEPDRGLGLEVGGRELNGEFKDCGGAQMRKSFLINSLAPDR
jgi:hypothetical protein